MLTTLESDFYSALNRAVEPAVRAGWGSPGIVPAGLIVLETKGRRTGEWHRTPLLASAIGTSLLVSTVRGRRSHWVKNLSHNAEAQYWCWGQLRSARATVFAPDRETPELQELSPLFGPLWLSLDCLSRDLGCAFALLTPKEIVTV